MPRDFYICFLLVLCSIPGITYLSLNVYGHRVEIYLGFKTNLLLSDGAILCEHKALLTDQLEFKSTINEKTIVVHVLSYLFKPLISVCVDGVYQDLSPKKRSSS